MKRTVLYGLGIAGIVILALGVWWLVGRAAQTAAPLVVDVDAALEKMGRFQLAMAQERAAAEGVEAQTAVRTGRLRPELVATATELGASLIVLGRPYGETAVFEEATLLAFAAILRSETGAEVRIL